MIDGYLLMRDTKGRQMNPRTPVVVGVGQVSNRSKDLDDAMNLSDDAEALYRAEEDSGARLLDQVGSVRVIRGVWDYANPAGFIAKRSAINSETMGTLFGGNQVQAVLNRSCLDILSGDHDLIVLTGAEMVAVAIEQGSKAYNCARRVSLGRLMK